MRTLNINVDEEVYRQIERLMISFDMNSMTKVFSEGVRVLGLFEELAHNKFIIPCVLRPFDGKILPLGPGLEYLQNVVERSEDNLIIPFVPKKENNYD